jgi:penicillin-binding protein 1C
MLQRRIVRVIGVGVVMILVLMLALDRIFPLPLPPEQDGVVVVAEDGTPLRAFPTSDGVWRYRVKPEDVSPIYLDALLGYEDRYFYWHPGINPISLLRAGGQWIQNGRIVSGGSTLSMQVARILDGPADRAMTTKLLQMARAVQLEWHLSKREILTLYLNNAPMGGIVEGVEMASRTYFGKSAKSLSHAEAALLTALPQSPTRHRPDTQPKRAEAARNKVLDRMVDIGRWTPEVVADAKIERVVAQSIRGEWKAPLAAQRMLTNVPARSDANDASDTREGVRVTTLDIELQTRIEAMIADRASSLPPKISLAALVMENDSLAVRAYVGSADFSDATRFAHVDMTQRVRSPGSTLKPFLYAMALDEGLIHSESLLVDAPQSFGGYAPGNFQASFTGPVSVSEALQRSLNVPAVDVLDRVGPAQFASKLRSAGLRLRMENGATPNLSLILGGAGTTLQELVGAYRALAAGGMAGTPRLSPHEAKIEARLMSEGAAWIVRDILESGGHPDRPFNDASTRAGFAWKTGTSFGFRDAWAVGVTDRYTIGVWIGRPDGTPNPGFFGANSAAPLARDIAAILPQANALRRNRPATVTETQICWPLGLARADTPNAHCHQERSAWTLNAVAPPTAPDRTNRVGLREAVYVDTATNTRVQPNCAATFQTNEVARWPAALTPWLSSEIIRRTSTPEWRRDCLSKSVSAGAIGIRGVENGSALRLPTGQKGALRLTLSTVGANGNVHWLLNGAAAGMRQADERIVMPIAKDGRYRISAIDEQGRYAMTEFVVRGVGG